MMIRGFEKINEKAIMPVRATKGSAGYDFFLVERLVLAPGEANVIKTYLKAYMKDDEFLSIHIRSSVSINKGLQLVNQMGIVDSDYYNNPDNEGHIMIFVRNTSDRVVIIEAGERIAQGIFMKYLLADGDNVNCRRRGGFGSTNKGEND